MAEINLKEAAASGLIWNTLQKYATLGISFVSSIILARLLTPYDYGCIGMLTIFITIATIMVDGGFGAALLQKKRPTQEDYSTIFYWNLIVSAILYVVLFFSAPYIAEFYKIPVLSKVLRVQGIVLFINAFKMVQSKQLRKGFRFKPMTITVIISSVISIIVTIIMAYLGYGVWSLVVQNLLMSALPMVAFWRITKWKPSLCFSKQSFKELFNFGGFMFLSSVTNTLADNVQGLLIGRFYNPATMGYYSKAWATESMASTGISSVINSFVLQLYSEVQDDYQTLRSILKRLTTTLVYVTCPLIVSMVLVATPLFIILYSDRWVPCVPYFRILAIAGLAICLQAVNTHAIAAIGKSKTLFYWTMVKRGCALGLILLGFFVGGIIGLLVGMVIGSWVSYFINSLLVSKYINYSMKKQLLDLLPIVLVAIGAAVPSYFVMKLISSAMIGPFVAMSVFLLLYFGVTALFKFDAYLYCKELIPFFKEKILRHRK